MQSFKLWHCKVCRLCDSTKIFKSLSSACRFLGTESVSLGTATEMCIHSHTHTLRNSPSRDGSLLKDTVLKTKQPRRRVIPLLPALLAGMQIAQINDLEFLEFPSQTLCMDPGLLAVTKLFVKFLSYRKWYSDIFDQL